MQLPGREGRIGESPYANIPTLARELVNALSGLVNELPFALFGHSNGALIAFEVALELRRRGFPTPIHLFVSASRAPHVPCRRPLIARLPEAEFIQEVLQLNGSPSEVFEDREFTKLILPALRADFAMNENYERSPSGALACPVTALLGAQDDRLAPKDIAEWSVYTSSSFDSVVIDGDHFFLRSHPQKVVAVIESRMLFSLGH